MEQKTSSNNLRNACACTVEFNACVCVCVCERERVYERVCACFFYFALNP